MSDEIIEVPDEQMEFYKRQLIKLGFFAAIITVLFGLILLFCLLSKNSFNQGLKERVNRILNENSINASAEVQVTLPSALSATAAAWKLSGNDSLYAVIIRVTTIYSSVPCIFTYDASNDETVFVSFDGVSEKAERSIRQAGIANQISYWKDKIPYFMKSAVKGEGK